MDGATYLLRDVQALLGISRSAITGLIAAGFISPSRGARREYRFTFQDLVMLRTAHSLSAANIPTRKILRSLRQLKETLPDELPLSGLRITAAGSEVAVRADDAQWQIESGQLLLDFEVKLNAGGVRFLNRNAGEAPARDDVRPNSIEDAAHWFEVGARFDPEDRSRAESAYRKAIGLAGDYVDAYLNLGCLLCDTGRCGEAVTLYRAALRYCPAEPRLHFNLALALEDAGHGAEALECYEASLKLSPDFSDAHYNAALLSESLGQASKAIRHFSAFRRLQKGA